MTPSISIIVPVYNVEQYLDQCLQSILYQSKKDIEIICINDGSTDSSLGILQKYANLDKRIIIIDKQNEWLWKTYNIWLNHAKWKYIGFVEPDDYIARTMYEELYKKIEEDNSDVARCGFYQVYSDGNTKETKPSFLYKKIKETKPFSPLDYPDIFLGHSAIWSWLYRKKTLSENDIRFMQTPGASFQDAPFCFEVLSRIESMSLIHQSYYYYRIHPGQSVKNWNAHFWKNIFIQIDTRIQKIEPKKSKPLIFIRLRRSIAEYTWWVYCLSKAQKKLLAGYIKKDYWDGKYDSIAHDLPFFEKIIYYIFRCNCSWILSVIWRWYIFIFNRM